MASKSIFGSARGPAADTTNEAGGKAYSFSDEHALAQHAVTGCINDTFYATAETQLDKVLELGKKVTPEFLAKTAVYARQEGLMKDMPALLLAILSTRDIGLTKKAFGRVCDDGKMVKNFVQIIRSGKVGRKSLGTALKRLVADWIQKRTDQQLINAMVGGDVSLSDLIKLVHPKPANSAKANLYAYIIGKNVVDGIPQELVRFELLKKKEAIDPLPNVPFQMLTNLDLTKEQWIALAKGMSWSQLRQSLNMLVKHGVFEKASDTAELAAKLSSEAQVTKAKAMPFQLMASFMASHGNVPPEISNALQDAMEHSLGNVPQMGGNTYVAVDVSGSMSGAATGNRGTATSTIRCIDVAALFGSAILRRNPNNSVVIPFAETVRTNVMLNARDSVMTNAQKLASIGGGGTDCSSVLRFLNNHKAPDVAQVIYVSDNESWIDNGYTSSARTSRTETMREWKILKKRCPKAKLVCIDIQPVATTPAKEDKDILNVGGFTDSVFGVVDLFLKGELDPSHWIGEINKVSL